MLSLDRPRIGASYGQEKPTYQFIKSGLTACTSRLGARPYLRELVDGRDKSSSASSTQHSRLVTHVAIELAMDPETTATSLLSPQAVVEAGFNYMHTRTHAYIHVCVWFRSSFSWGQEEPMPDLVSSSEEPSPSTTMR